MRRYFFITLFLCCVFSVFSQNTFKFAGFSWGTNVSYIENNNGRPNETETENGLLMFTYWGKKVYTYDTDITFIFIDNELVGGAYDINACHRIRPGKYDSKYYYNAYYDLKNKLTSEYGNPINSNEVSKINGQSFDSLSQRTQEILLKGSMPIYSVWETNGTMITLVFEYDSDWTLLYSFSSNKLLEK